MKAGIYQMKPLFGKKEANLRKAETVISNLKCDLIALPELFSTGYSFISKAELGNYAEQIPGGNTTEFLVELACKNSCYIAAGLAEIENDDLYNTAVFIGPHGFIGKYRKLHLFYKEKFIFKAGNLPLQIFNMEGIKVSLIICFDWIYPEVCRSVALKGAHIVIHPSNLLKPWAQMAMRIRSVEKRIFTMIANRVGVECRSGEGLQFSGRSQISDPKGEILLSFPKAREAFACVDIDPAVANDKLFT